jgi:cytochrome c peroxidase
MIARHLWLASWLLSSLQAANLTIEVKHLWEGQPVALSASWQSAGKDSSLSLSRVAYLISEPLLIDTKGEGHTLPDWYELVDLGSRRTTLNLENLPALEFAAVEFSIGLNPAINKSDPAKFGPKHPLNPILNKLHWNWQDGYIFLALEGHWMTAEKEGGYSYHLGNEPHRMRIRLPLSLDLSKDDAQLVLDFHLDRVLKDIPFEKASSTHGRIGDLLALSLKKKIERAFQISAIQTRYHKFSATHETQKSRPFVGKAYPLKISENFPIPALPVDYPLSYERIELGRRLFHDALLSRDNSVSCFSCHRTENAFADDQPLSTGIDQQLGRRNSMPLMNLAWKNDFFWDGRTTTLREQALVSIQNATEMNASLPEIEKKLSSHPAYPSLFKGAYGSREITAERIGIAIEQFILIQTSYDSRFDRAIKGDDTLSEIEQRGLELFFTEYDPRRQQYGADCFHCHGGPLFSDQDFHNNGLPLTKDHGLAEVTQRDSDIGKFSTPSLRNIHHTAPYMHDGRFPTLEAVLEHYRSGIQRSPTLDPNLAKHPAPGIPLSEADTAALIAFLKTLSDSKFLSRQ